MDFGKQIKKLRAEQKITQEQMAEKLGISRQAVSNWENDRNLPDIEMLIFLSRVFGISLDELILGGNEMNNMTQKLINDSSENKRAKINLAEVCIGAALLLAGAACLAIKAFYGSSVGADGILHEMFFLVPIAFLFFAAGTATFMVVGAQNAVRLAKTNSKATGEKKYAKLGLGVAAICLGSFLVLLEANSGAHTSLWGAAVFGGGIVTVLFSKN